MRLPKRGERGFTLIELLIVVAILGVLAAVVIPNIQRFIGAGESEAEETELANIQTAVSAMMVDNEISTFQTGFVAAETDRTNEMTKFPHEFADAATGKVTDPDGDIYDFGATDPDLKGYILYGHDIDASPLAEADDDVRVNYVAQPTTAYWYWVDATGTVYQETTAP